MVALAFTGMLSLNWGFLFLLVLLASLTAAIVIMLARRRRQDEKRGPRPAESSIPSQAVRDSIATTDFSPGGKVENQIGRYHILEHLGSGGMGTVYKAFDPQLDRVVALKLPHFHGTGPEVAKRMQRFQREAQAAARIWHPNVCPIYDVGDHHGQPFVVMAWVDGPSLAKRLTESGRFENIGHAVSLICNLLDGLDTVHAHGILHRDLKPANILIDPSGRPIISDFGLARTEMNADPITSEGVIVGTPSYMAPEQAGYPETVGPWTDIYSVGVVFYQMVTGRLPFEGTALEVLAKVAHEQPVPPTHYRSDLPLALEGVILKALARAPLARFANARQFRAALDGWQKGDPENSYPSVATADGKPSPDNDTYFLSSETPARSSLSPLHSVAGWLLTSMRQHWRGLLLAVIFFGIAIGLALDSSKRPQPVYQGQPPARPKPLRIGYIQGDLLIREPNGIAHSKCDGFKVECYETFVVVYVDSAKQPTWTGNYVLTIPWNKIEHMTLRPEMERK